MARTLSLTFRNAMMAENTGAVVVALLTISHPLYLQPLRISSDPTQRITDVPLTYATISRGNTYTFVPMTLVLPDDIDERAPTARLIVDNISRELITAIRSFTSPPKCSMELVLSDSPNVVEVAYPEFDIKNTQYNPNSITFELAIESLTDEPLPAGSFNPSGFPGLF